MRAYIATSGGIFALVVVAHAWRIAAENPALLRDPWYLGLTAAAAALAFWAWRAYRKAPR